MKIKIGAVLYAYNTLSAIIRDNRPLPTKCKYRISRIFKQLEKEIELINEQRNSLIQAHGEQVKTETSPEPVWQVPESKMKEFQKVWNNFILDEIELDFQKIPISSFGDQTSGEVTIKGLDGSVDTVKTIELISLNELLALEEFIEDDEAFKKNDHAT